MCSSYVVITWNLGHIDSVATTIGWARWLGEGENQVFPTTHFPVQPYYRCIEIHFDCSVPFCVGHNTSIQNHWRIISVTNSLAPHITRFEASQGPRMGQTQLYSSLALQVLGMVSCWWFYLGFYQYLLKCSIRMGYGFPVGRFVNQYTWYEF